MQTSDLNVNNTESDHANAIFRQFQDAIFSREHTYVKTLTKIIFDLLQWQEIAKLSLPKKAAIASFIWTTFRAHFRLGANDITRNRSRVIFCRACADIFRRWTCFRYDDNDIKDGWRRQGRNLRSDEAKSPASKFVLRCFILLKKNIFYKKTLLQYKVNEYYFGA